MEEQAAQAERQRLAQQAQKAREAGVFFQIANRAAPASASGAGQGAGVAMAGELPPATDANRLNLDPDRDQNNQQRKLDFLNQPVEKSIYNPHALQTPASPYQVMAGSIIAASLVTGLNSDLPGLVVAQVTENVYDSVTGRTLLIPQGARLIGSYDSVVAFGQSRALLVWRRIVLPDGSSVQIDNLPATDAAGYAGLEDEVDYHTWRLLKGVALSTLLGVGTELNRDNEKAPAFRLFVGQSRIGDAWQARSGGDSPKDYLRVRLDDPSLPEPISAALFHSEDGKEAQLVWNRRSEQR